MIWGAKGHWHILDVAFTLDSVLFFLAHFYGLSLINFFKYRAKRLSYFIPLSKSFCDKIR